MGQSVNKVAENILYQVFLTKDNTAHTQKHTHTKNRLIQTSLLLFHSTITENNFHIWFRLTIYETPENGVLSVQMYKMWKW